MPAAPSTGRVVSHRVKDGTLRGMRGRGARSQALTSAEPALARRLPRRMAASMAHTARHSSKKADCVLTPPVWSADVYEWRRAVAPVGIPCQKRRCRRCDGAPGPSTPTADSYSCWRALRAGIHRAIRAATLPCFAQALSARRWELEA